MFLQTEGSTGVDADKDKDEGRSKATKVYNNESLLGGKVYFSPFIFFLVAAASVSYGCHHHFWLQLENLNLFST